VHDDKQIIAETKYLRLVSRGNWQYVERRGATGVVIVIPVTADGRLILIEQYRVPVAGRVIEFPAGLVGDDSAGEPAVKAARRELLEETGYEASEFNELPTVTTSAGMTSETATFFLARDCVKTAKGGGVGGEDIQIHAIPLTEVDAWLDAARARGRHVAGRLYAGLYFLSRAA